MEIMSVILGDLYQEIIMFVSFLVGSLPDTSVNHYAHFADKGIDGLEVKLVEIFIFFSTGG